MYQSQQRSTDLCTDFYIHYTHDSFCGGNCLRSKLWILYGGCDKSVPYVALGYTNPYAVLAGRASLYITDYFIMHCLSGRCHIRYRVFPVKTPAFIVQ
jgi:hypothetical protein